MNTAISSRRWLHAVVVVLWAGACAPAAPPPAETTVAATLATAADKWFTRGDVTIRYREIGSGTPVLMLHGYTDNLDMWATPADSLARDHRVIVPDLRGFGKSSKFGDPSRYGQHMVNDLVALLDHAGVESAHVIGYSMGGILAANLAVHHPSRVRTATFAAGAFFADTAEVERLVLPHAERLARGEGLDDFFAYILPTWSDSSIKSLLPIVMAQNDSASLVGSLRAFNDLLLDWGMVARTSVPAVAVVSAADPMVAGSRMLGSAWPGIRVVVLAKGDHADIHLAPELLQEFRQLTQRVVAGTP